MSNLTKLNINQEKKASLRSCLSYKAKQADGKPLTNAVNIAFTMTVVGKLVLKSAGMPINLDPNDF